MKNKMNISKEHIEELIFDYHEGNLSDSEKSELLNLIHQNPEFESDFALWAQTYAHVESSVPDYGLVASLLQKPAVAWYSQAWAKVGVSALVVTGGILGYWALSKKSEPETHFVPSETVKVLSTEAKENSLISTKPNTTNKQNSKLKIENKKIHTISVIQESVLEKPVSEINVEAPQAEQTLEVSETSKVLEVEITKPDTLAKTVLVEPQKKQEEKPAKKTKRKLPLNLKPSPDFMPVNPNF
jgi:hypothetical protein